MSVIPGVKKVISLGRSGVLLECTLPALTEKQQGQFPFQSANPFIFDAIVQSLLIWTQRYFHNPCLPSHLVRLDHYQPIPFDQTCFVEMQVVSANETAIVSDLWVTDKKITSWSNTMAARYDQSFIEPLYRGKKPAVADHDTIDSKSFTCNYRYECP